MIDWAFITGQEGEKLQGYVPSAGDSGVTIATGIDLGQWTAPELESLPADLQARLEPFLGLKGAAAKAALLAHPLTVTLTEAQLLDSLAQASITRPLIAHFTSAGTSFDSLIDAAQTVVASVSYQYGSTWARCPHFWSLCVERNYSGMVSELNDFGDAYPSRRKREAQYLSTHINGEVA